MKVEDLIKMIENDSKVYVEDKVPKLELYNGINDNISKVISKLDSYENIVNSKIKCSKQIDSHVDTLKAHFNFLDKLQENLNISRYLDQQCELLVKIKQTVAEIEDYYERKN